MRNSRMRPITALIGSAFVASLASASFADTSANPFGAEELAQGYSLLADAHEGAKEGEGTCGEGKCGEGKCGESTGGEAAPGDGNATEGNATEGKAGEGKCGEGKCGEGKCGEAKS